MGIKNNAYLLTLMVLIVPLAGCTGTDDSEKNMDMPDLGIISASQNTNLLSGHSCNFQNGSLVSCWGSNQFGQIGDGTTTDRHTPTTIDGFGSGRTAVGISAGSKHTCAILDDGSVSCWGHSAKGQLGYGDTEFRRAPTPTMSLGTSRSAIALSLGTYHTCALLDDGGVKCWGDNEYGQLGDGTEIDSYSPSSSVLANVMRISSSGKHSCAILNDGSVSCWGINNGQFGDGSTVDSNIPVTAEVFVDGRKAVEISTGGSHTCVILDDNSISCWGRNDTGQLGDGTTEKRLTPTQIFTNDSG